MEKRFKVEDMLTQIVIEENDKDVFSILVPPHVIVAVEGRLTNAKVST